MPQKQRKKYNGKPHRSFKPLCENGPRFDGDPEYNRPITQHLTTVMSMLSGHKPREWGFTIIRTAYDDDRQFERAVSHLFDAVCAYSDAEQQNVRDQLKMINANAGAEKRRVPLKVDTSMNREFLSSFGNDVIQSQRRLNGASVDSAREQFRDWIVANQGNASGSNMRYVFAILMDKETMENLDKCGKKQVEASRHESRQTPMPWVKVLDIASDVSAPYRVNLYGDYNIVQYWFDRSLLLHPPSMYLRKADDGANVLFYGSLQQAEAGSDALHQRTKNILAKMGE